MMQKPKATPEEISAWIDEQVKEQNARDKRDEQRIEAISKDPKYAHLFDDEGDE